MELCSLILSLTIVGAYETRPGIMYVQYLDHTNIEELYVYTEDYVNCWDNGIPVEIENKTPAVQDVGRNASKMPLYYG